MRIFPMFTVAVFFCTACPIVFEKPGESDSASTSSADESSGTSGEVKVCEVEAPPPLDHCKGSTFGYCGTYYNCEKVYPPCSNYPGNESKFCDYPPFDFTYTCVRNEKCPPPPSETDSTSMVPTGDFENGSTEGTAGGTGGAPTSSTGDNTGEGSSGMTGTSTGGEEEELE